MASTGRNPPNSDGVLSEAMGSMRNLLAHVNVPLTQEDRRARAAAKEAEAAEKERQAKAKDEEKKEAEEQMQAAATRKVTAESELGGDALIFKPAVDLARLSAAISEAKAAGVAQTRCRRRKPSTRRFWTRWWRRKRQASPLGITTTTTTTLRVTGPASPPPPPSPEGVEVETERLGTSCSCMLHSM